MPSVGRHGAAHWILWFLGSGALLAAVFAVSTWTPAEGKIGADTAAWTQIIQGHSQDRRREKRQRSGHAGLHMACEVRPRSCGIQRTAGSRAHNHHNDLPGAELGFGGHKFILMSRFPLDIDYILCTRRAETANIGEWTIQAPIPESLWGRQSEPGGKRWD